MTEQLDVKLLERFKKLVSGHLGLSIRQEDAESFRMALTAQMKRVDIEEPERYLSFLESDTAESKREWKALIISITTGESYFFRDKGHFFLLQNTILPELIEKNKNHRSLRIWSAGCSTGEEPYSIAILLDVLLSDLKGWDIFIIGTDINEESLKKAEKGKYSKWSFRMLDKDIQRKYFKRQQDEWELHEGIKKMVKFQYGNLMESRFFSQNPEICAMDIIICRNVFIYFNKDAVSSVFNKFIYTLNNEGYLITGHGELYGHDLMGLRQIMYPEAVIYKKTTELKGQFPVSGPAMPVPKAGKLKPGETGTRIADLAKQGNYTEAIARAEGLSNAVKDDNGVLYLMAWACADAGDYDKAESICRKVMSASAASADPYFLLAHIAEARGNDDEAKELFKKAIYLNPAFIAAYCELGGLYEKEKDIPRAKKARTAAIELLKSLPFHAPVKPYDITAGELLKYVEYLTGARDADLMPAGPVEKSRR